MQSRGQRLGGSQSNNQRRDGKKIVPIGAGIVTIALDTTPWTVTFEPNRDLDVVGYSVSDPGAILEDLTTIEIDDVQQYIGEGFMVSTVVDANQEGSGDFDGFDHPVGRVRNKIKFSGAAKATHAASKIAVTLFVLEEE